LTAAAPIRSPRREALKRVLLRIKDPSARKIVIMSKWQRGEIAPEEAEALIRELGLKEA
jgi:hypothetical protein